jgi:hypothetical protein
MYAVSIFIYYYSVVLQAPSGLPYLIFLNADIGEQLGRGLLNFYWNCCINIYALYLYSLFIGIVVFLRLKRLMPQLPPEISEEKMRQEVNGLFSLLLNEARWGPTLTIWLKSAHPTKLLLFVQSRSSTSCCEL